jgi:FixJ family two-component response regulator
MTKSQCIVAVVDDDPSMLNSIEYLLDAHGFSVELYSSAETFTKRDPLDDISCLVLDIHLGGMSGFDLQHLLSERGYRFPVIFITAVADEVIARTAQDSGCPLLRKPFSSGGLINAIRRAIERNQ